MDKYLIKLSAAPKHDRSSFSGPNYKKQATLESLKGVVVIEDIEHAKVVLERQETSSKLKIKTLEELHKKKPCQEVLKKTQIGKTVHQLCKSSDPAVASKAKDVYKLWKNHILSKVGRPSIEVQCDAKTRNMRTKGKQLIINGIKKGLNGTDLANSIFTSDENEKNKNKMIDVKSLSEHIEGEVYRSTKRNFDKSYQRTMRKIIFALTYQQALTEAVVKSEMSVEDFVKDFLKA